jgi:hypothetical protein
MGCGDEYLGCAFHEKALSFFNVWGIHFDPEKGRPAGEPFRVSAFERPRLMVPQIIDTVGLSITKNQLLLTMSKVSGGIWVLDNVDR